MDMTDSNAVDIGRRYDIYVAETPNRVVVYRSAFFRGVKYLEKTRTYDYGSEFFEIEQANGDVVMLKKHTVTKFCDPGGKVTPEVVT